ncbi:hypothetical protein A3K63_05040 [Candidatus Micrarchaeota archaeon RBG_16_49_10]|nr:MAG: hypothetical protein A3K63_05040 [Candidatus Micrarchaeota archaeon RBG_16_49_10]
MLTVDLETDFGVFETTKCMGVLSAFLNMLDENGIRATFFVNGKLIPKFSDELREIGKRHEIACHGLDHERLTGKPIGQVRDELTRLKKLFKDNIGVNPIGFRAPFFRTNKDILEMLPELGFRYDSSLVPGILPGRYFNLTAKGEPYMVGKLLEIPISRNVVPFGSTWFQLIGKKNFSWLFSAHKKYNNVIYAHLNEFCGADFDLGLKRRLFYRNRGEKVLKDFGEFLKECKKDYEFGLCRDLLKKT